MYEKILIVVDGEPTSRVAIKEGVALAKIYAAEVVFFSVLPRYIAPMGDMPALGLLSPDEFARNASKDAERWLAAAAIVADRAGVTHLAATSAGADDAECVAAAARKRRCGLIVVSSVGRNAVVRLLTGSVIPGLITQATVPVLVCPQPRPTRASKRAQAAP